MTASPVNEVEFPYRRTSPLSPPDEYARLRVEAPLIRVRIWDGSRPWLVTRYDDIRAILGDARFSADYEIGEYPGPLESMSHVRETYPTFVTMDNPRHDVYRRHLTREFTVKRIETLRPMVRGWVEGLIERMLEQEGVVDYVQHLALALPSAMICYLLGVPEELQPRFQELTRIMASGDSSKEVASAAVEEMCEEILRPMVRERVVRPTEDVFGSLAALIGEGELTEDEVVSLGRLLLVAGHDTTGSMIALSTLSALLDPALKQRIIEDPESIPRIVEDLLRFWNIDNVGLRRVATEDVEIDGTVIARGEGVILAIASGDRDESVFEHAERIDPDRENLRAHMAFGYGIHQCLGQNLARMELQEVLAQIFRRVPTLELAAPLEELKFDDQMFNYGVEALPVRW